MPADESEPSLPAGAAWLFCPADRPERFAKAAAAADVVILDLEDAVAKADRPKARENLAAARLDPATTVVRVNAADTDDHDLDVAAVRTAGYRHLMLPKAERPEHLAGVGGFGVIALCETAVGILHAETIARAPGVEALMFGAEDLMADVGGRSSRSGRAFRGVAAQARSTVLLAAAAAGRPAIDAVYLAIADADGLAAEAEDAVESGFAAKACIHPTQVAIVRAAFQPSAEQLDWAHRVLAQAKQSAGVFTLDGAMVDEPVLRQAAAIVRRDSSA